MFSKLFIDNYAVTILQMIVWTLHRTQGFKDIFRLDRGKNYNNIFY